MSADSDYYDDEVEIDDRPCAHCDAGHTYTRPCQSMGCEDGYVNRYEEDPLWYDDEYVRCPDCRGRGYAHWCSKCGKGQPRTPAQQETTK